MTDPGRSEPISADPHGAAADPTWIDLAREPDFQLGQAHVSPAASEISVGPVRVRLQHRVMQVLVALVRAAGGIVSRDSLVASCWGGIAVSDDAINRCIQQLRRLAENDLAGAYAIETLPRVGYRLNLTDDSASSQSRSKKTAGVRRLAAVAALLVAASAAGLFLFLRPGGNAAAGAPPVAVLPFKTASADLLERAVADGVAEEVGSALANTDLKILGEGLPADPAARQTAAQQLGARFVVDGLVARSADHRLVLDVHLDDLRGHDLLWSARFERPETQAQTLQEQVAAKIAGVAQCALDVNGFNGGRTDDDTVRLYLKACDLKDEPEGKAQLQSLLEQIVQREPGFAKAWSTLALFDAQASSGDSLPTSGDAASLRMQAAGAIRHAQSLDPKDPQIYAALYDLQPYIGKWRDSEAILAEGLAVRPEAPELLDHQSDLLEHVGRMDEAASFARRAMELDPLSPSRTITAISALAFRGVPNDNLALADARRVADRAIRIWPDDPQMWWTRMAITVRAGDPEDALRIIDGDPYPPPGADNPALKHWRETAAVRASHDPARVRAYVDEITADLSRNPAYFNLAVLDMMTVGATDAAYAAITNHLDLSDVDTTIFFRPYARDFRRDPRFMPFAARLGLVDYWRTTGHWPDFCLAADRPYDCKAVAATLSRTG